MGSISDFLELELLDHVFNASWTPPTTVYVGLSTADPTDSGGGLSEPVGNGYLRKPISFLAASSRSVVQNGSVAFNEASGDWGTITHWALFTQESSGSMMAHGALGASKEVVSGNTPSIADAEIDVTVTADEMSDYLANAILDFAFRNQSLTVTATYVALTTATISASDTGSSITEPGAGAYERRVVNPNGGSSPTWDIAASGLVDNTHDITFVTATASWGTIVAVCICDASTGGNMLFFDNAMADQAVGSGDTVVFELDNLDITLD